MGSAHPVLIFGHVYSPKSRIFRTSMPMRAMVPPQPDAAAPSGPPTETPAVRRRQRSVSPADVDREKRDRAVRLLACRSAGVSEAD